MSRLPLMLRSVVILAFCSMSLAPVCAQTPAQYVARGDKEMLDGFPESALFYYRLALKADTNDVEATFKTGEAYRAQRNYRRAESSYRRAAALDEQDEYPEALFWVGMMQKQLGEYAMAKRNIQAFLSIYRQRDDFYRWARDEESSCDWALEHKNDDPRFAISVPDTGLNTEHAEMSPFLLDSATMYFATMRYEKDVVKKNAPVFVELKKAVHQDGAWALTDLDIPVADPAAHVGNGVLSADSSRFYYSHCLTPSECELYVIHRRDGLWGKPERLGAPVNESGCSTTQPALGIFDGKEYLYFASDRSSGKGGMDIWYVEMKDGAPTTRLRNAGTRINTKGNEITPWFQESDTCLYFSSDRQPGFGGFDLFCSKGAPGNFDLVANLGTGINSPADDYYFYFRSSDSLGYFASNRISGTKKAGNETCCNDLYLARIMVEPDTMPEPEDTLIIAQTDTLKADTTPIAVADSSHTQSPAPAPETIEELQELLPISLYFHNDRPNPRTMATTTELTYVETIEEYLTLETEYRKAINGSSASDEVKTRMLKELEGFFDTNLRESVVQLNAALDVLLLELERGEIIELEVKGYASPLANSDYNLNLTYRRIAAMENYIRSYRNGAFLPYLNTASAGMGHLTIIRTPYGESQASSNLSDDLNDKVGAIYAPKVALERRIEILRVERK